MPMERKVRKAARWAAAAAIGAAALAGGARGAHAQAAGDSVSGDGKGIVGGALLGGEVVMLTMGAIGVEQGWPYLVFGGLGAVAGGVGGYFIESAGPPAEAPLYMLAGGMALVIPTIVVTLNATAYKPPESDQSEPIQNEPALEPPQGGASVQITSDARTPARRRGAARRAPAGARTPSVAAPRLGLFDITPERLAIGMPALELRPLYSQAETFRFGVAQGEELRFPVLRATF